MYDGIIIMVNQKIKELNLMGTGEENVEKDLAIIKTI